jgi:hypothetical protein
MKKLAITVLTTSLLTSALFANGNMMNHNNMGKMADYCNQINSKMGKQQFESVKTLNKVKEIFSADEYSS